MGHIDRQVVADLLTPLADGTFAWTPLSNSVLIAAATVALAI